MRILLNASLEKLVYSDHVVGQGHVCPVHAKVQAIDDLLVTKKGLMRFLGLVGPTLL